MRRSTPSVNASSAPTTSSRSRPRSSAKWLRVPAGNADVGDVAPRGNRRHKRLRPVASGHPDDLRAACDGALGELEQVIARLKDDRLDASPPSLPGEVETLGLAAARLQVDDQRRRGRRRPPARPRRPPCEPPPRRSAPVRSARPARTRRAAGAARAAPAPPASGSPAPRPDRPRRAPPAPRRTARRAPRSVRANQIARGRAEHERDRQRRRSRRHPPARPPPRRPSRAARAAPRSRRAASPCGPQVEDLFGSGRRSAHVSNVPRPRTPR